MPGRKRPTRDARLRARLERGMRSSYVNADMSCVSLYDRDYMRARQGHRDPYWDWLHGSDFGSHGVVTPERLVDSAGGEEYDFWTRPITFRQLRLPLMLVLMVFAAFVLPHLTIDGRHWHVWLLP